MRSSSRAGAALPRVRTSRCGRSAAGRGPTTRASLYLRREAAGALRVGLNLTRAVQAGRIVVRDGARSAPRGAAHADARGGLRRSWADLTAKEPYTVEVRDAAGRVLLAHTENRYDFVPRSEVKTGPQAPYVFPPAERRSEGDWLELGRYQELNGKLLEAHDAYDAALAAFPESVALHRAAGRLAVGLKRYAEAIPHLSRVVARASNDGEALYYLGLAQDALGETQQARFAWDQAAAAPGTRAPSLLQLAGSRRAREGDAAEALRRLREPRSPTRRGSIRAGGMEVALLRQLGRTQEAKARLRHWLAEDPASSLLRNEAGPARAQPTPSLWAHLASDPERVLEVAVDYMALGLWDGRASAARALLPVRRRRRRARGGPAAGLPARRLLPRLLRGAPRPLRPRGLRARVAPVDALRLSEPARVDARCCAARSRRIPSDATAHFLLGSLFLSGGQTEEALAEWEQARALDPRIPVLHRNIGLTLLYARRDGADGRAARVRGGDGGRSARTSSSTRAPTRR